MGAAGREGEEGRAEDEPAPRRLARRARSQSHAWCVPSPPPVVLKANPETKVEYLAWPDHGVPNYPSHLLAFIRTMTSLHHTLSPLSPPLLHCSAGVGRTGTYLTIASLLPLLSLFRTAPPPLEPLEHPSNHPLPPYPADELLPGTRDYVGLTIDGLRDHRTTMCQTLEQVRWCYEALEVAWREGIED